MLIGNERKRTKGKDRKRERERKKKKKDTVGWSRENIKLKKSSEGKNTRSRQRIGKDRYTLSETHLHTLEGWKWYMVTI